MEDGRRYTNAGRGERRAKLKGIRGDLGLGLNEVVRETRHRIVVLAIRYKKVQHKDWRRRLAK